MSWNLPVTPVTPTLVMTWNTRWKGGERKLGGWDWDDRLPVIDSVIQRENPDVLLLQEDTEDMTADLLFTGFIDRYHLPLRHTPVFLGDKRATHDRYNHELCGIFWKKGLYECVTSGCYGQVKKRNGSMFSHGCYWRGHTYYWCVIHIWSVVSANLTNRTTPKWWDISSVCYNNSYPT
jgi:hypothetical protein